MTEPLATETLRVLLVEDSAEDRFVVERALSSRGEFEVAWARRLADAQSMLGSQRFDAIVLDLTLPDSDHEQTLPAVHRAASNLPIVVLTGSTDERTGIEAVANGAQDYLVKGDRALALMLARSVKYAIARHRAEAELRAAREQLLSSQKMEGIGRLAGGVAHDLNNILTAIFSFGDFVLGELPHDGPAYEDMQEVLGAARRAEQLTNQLLAFSRRKTVSPRIVDLNEVVAEIGRMLRRLLGEDIELITELDPDVGAVYIDPSAFEQVLVNLAVNARDAMPAGGRLTIETGNQRLEEALTSGDLELPPGDYVYVAFSDNGVGMDEATRAQIFEPFFTTKPQGKGTGLGLSTCYGIVAQASGCIDVYSEVGRGTTFKVRLPRSSDSAQPLARPAPVAPVQGDESILVVEDDPSVRRLAARSLRQLGYQVQEARGGAEALALCDQRDGAFDLILTDVIMQGMNGKRLAQRLGQRYPQMKVLFMSGYTANAIVHHGVLEPDVALLQKPFTPTELGTAVREVLDSETHVAASVAAPRILAAMADRQLPGELAELLGDWELVTARDGFEVLSVLARQDFDAVVADPAMLGLPAEELLDHLRATDPLLAAKVVFVRDDDRDASSLVRALTMLLG